MFAGFTALGDTFFDLLLVKDPNGLPLAPDAAPTYRVYGASGVLLALGGSTTLNQSGAVTGASNATPIEITSANHGLQTGTRVTVAGVLGNPAANGVFVVTRTGTNTFTLAGSVGNGVYTSGGTWNVTGLYKVTFTADGASGFEAGENYWLVYAWTVAGGSRADLHSFGIT